MKDYYYILGVKNNATNEDIKKSYKRLSNKMHPDKNNGDSFYEGLFKEIQEAYKTLTDETLKKQYERDYQEFFSQPTKRNEKSTKPKSKSTKEHSTQYKREDKSHSYRKKVKQPKRKTLLSILLKLVVIIFFIWLIYTFYQYRQQSKMQIWWSQPKTTSVLKHTKICFRMKLC